MPSKNTSVISARVRDEIAVKLGEIAENKGYTIAKLIEEMVTEYEKEPEEKGVTPISYAVSYDSSFAEKVDRKFDKLRDRGYPERFIESMKEQILNGIDNQISMLPKKFDMRRMKDNDTGC